MSIELRNMVVKYIQAKRLKNFSLIAAILTIIPALYIQWEPANQVLTPTGIFFLVLSLVGHASVSRCNKLYKTDIFNNIFKPKLVDGDQVMLNMDMKNLFKQKDYADRLVATILRDFTDYIEVADGVQVENMSKDNVLIDMDGLMTNPEFHQKLVDIFVSLYSDTMQQAG